MVELGVLLVGTSAIRSRNNVINVTGRCAHDLMGVPSGIATANLRFYKRQEDAELNSVEQMMPPQN